MSVIIDHQPLQPEQLGLRTVGEVLSHVHRENRLVMSVLIDGKKPDPKRLRAIRQSPLAGHTVQIETAEPRRIALEVLAEVERQLQEAEKLKAEAIELLKQNGAGVVKAMEKLSGCFSSWKSAQESVLKTAQLLRIDLSKVTVAARSLTELLSDFKSQLRQIKAAMDHRNFPVVGQMLTDRLGKIVQEWTLGLGAIRDVIR